MYSLNGLPICFVTWVTHNSRVSERMVEFLPPGFIKSKKSFILNYKLQLRVAHLIALSSEKYKLPIVTFNVLPDHVHMLVVVKNEEELALKIGNLKGFSAHILRKENHIKSKIWARKFNRKWIKDTRSLYSVINYIDENHHKHEKSWGRHFICGFGAELRKIVESVCISSGEE